MSKEEIKKLINSAKDIDGDAYFTLETVLDAFRAGIELGSKSVGKTTNKNTEKLSSYDEAIQFIKEDR
jgi:hypothetical protein